MRLSLQEEKEREARVAQQEGEILEAALRASSQQECRQGEAASQAEGEGRGAAEPSPSPATKEALQL